MKLKKFFLSILCVVVLIVSIIPCFSVSALTTYNFVCSRPQINESSCYFEIVTQAGEAYVFYVTIGLNGHVVSGETIFDFEPVNLTFDSTIRDGNLWVYPTGISSLNNVDLESYYINGFLISQDGSLKSASKDTTIRDGRISVGVYVGPNYKCIRAYNCFRTSNGSDIIFSYGNEININNKLDTIIGALQGGNQQIIDNQDKNASEIQQNQNENTDKVIQNQEENNEEIKNGWQQEEGIDTSTTDDYAAKDQELQEATEQGRSEAVSLFNSFGSLFQGDGHLYKGLMSVSAIMNEFLKIDWLSSILNFALALGIFAFVIGTGSSVLKWVHGKTETNSQSKYASSERDRAHREGLM